MSSLTRRMQIRGLKRLGYRREKFRIVKCPDGRELRIAVSRGGPIVNADGERIGDRWPRRAVA